VTLTSLKLPRWGSVLQRLQSLALPLRKSADDLSSDVRSGALFFG
jgi:hypothetical protein